MNELESGYVLSYLLKASGLSKSTYHYYKVKGWDDKYAGLKQVIMKIYEDSHRAYGYRKITSELAKQYPRHVNHKLVQKLMQEMNIRSICKPKWRVRNDGAENAASPNIVNRAFSSDAPFRIMTTDVTEIKWRIYRIFLSPLMDFYDDSIINYSIGLHQNTDLVLSMMEGAKNIIGDMTGCIIHSDQGTLYKSTLYRKFLSVNNISQSMSRRGNCYDNAPIENFFGCLKAEIIYGKRYSSLNEIISAIKDWIDYYNNDRILLKLGGFSPLQARINYY
ncbi:MAG: IS3 family transposase [Bacteroidales bacterium]|nr:IS3 family transposase [Bacteroidales bacterium]